MTTARCDRPGDPEGRIVPAHAGGQFGRVEIGHLVQHLGSSRECLEAVRHAGGMNTASRLSSSSSTAQCSQIGRLTPGAGPAAHRGSHRAGSAPACPPATAATGSAGRAPCRGEGCRRCSTARSPPAGRARGTPRAQKERAKKPRASAWRSILTQHGAGELEGLKLHVSASRTRRRSARSPAGTSAA